MNFNMATPVKLFQNNITLGYFVWCVGDDFLEPEGVIFFDSPPKIGDTAILSGGKLWKVCRESNEQMEIIMEQV